MAKKKTYEEKKEFLIKKYDYKIGELLREYWDKKPELFYMALEKLRNKMEKELNKIENIGHQVDKQDVSSNE